MVTRRLFELYIRIFIHRGHWAVVTGRPSSTFITCFIEQPDSSGERYYFFLHFIIPALNSLMDQKAHDLGESVVHNFKANLHILLALWLSEMCSLPLQLQGSRFHKQKHTMPCVFFFFFFGWWFCCLKWLPNIVLKNLPSVPKSKRAVMCLSGEKKNVLG